MNGDPSTQPANRQATARQAEAARGRPSQPEPEAPPNRPRSLSRQPINRQRAHHATPAKQPTNLASPAMDFRKKGSRGRITGEMPAGFQPQPFHRVRLVSSPPVFYSHIIPASVSGHQSGNNIFLSHHSSSSLPNTVLH